MPGFLIAMTDAFIQKDHPYNMLSVMEWAMGFGLAVFAFVLLGSFPFELNKIRHKAKTTEYYFYEDRFICKMAGEMICEVFYQEIVDLLFLSKQPKGPSRRGAIRLTLVNNKSQPLAGRVILNVEESVYYKILACIGRLPGKNINP